MSIRAYLGLGALAVALLWGAPVLGQTTIVNEVTGVSGFDFSNNSMYFWRAGRTCGSGTDTLGYSVRRNSPFFEIRIEACARITQGPVAMSSANFYFIRNVAGTFRIERYNLWDPVNSTTSIPLAADGMVPVNLHVGTNGRIYIAQRNTGNGDFRIRSVNWAGGDVQTHVSATTTASTNIVRQLEQISYQQAGNFRPALLYIVNDRLFRKDLDSAAAPVQLDDLVEEFVYIRNLPGLGERIFATRNITLFRKDGEQAGSTTTTDEKGSSFGGYVRRIPPTGGTPTTVYYDPGGTFRSIAVDNDNFYWTELAATKLIRRRAHGSSATPATLLSVDVSELDNLKSDGQHVYYRRSGPVSGHLIQRISTGAPSIQLDIIADAVEAVQTTQILASTAERPKVFLIAKRPAVVRGYARLGTNTTGSDSFRVPATLRLFHNGVEIPDFTGYALTTIDATSGAANTRGDMTRSFTFNVPGQYIREGNMEFRMTVNEGRVIPETATLTNNTISNTFPVEDRGVPTVRFWRTEIEDLPTFELGWVANLPEFKARTLSFVPFEDFKIRERGGVLKKLQITPNPLELFHRWVPFEMPQNQNNMLTHLSIAALFENWLSRTLPVAMVHPEVPSFNGLGVMVMGCLVRMASREGTGFNFPTGAFVLAHEWGHVNFLGHVHNDESCGTVPDGPHQPFPFNTCDIGPDEPLAYWGFDPITRTIISPTSAGDVMSYRRPAWTSPVIWEAWGRPRIPLRRALFEEIPLVPKGASAEHQLAIVGVWNSDSELFGEFTSYQVPTDLVHAETLLGVSDLNRGGAPGNFVRLRTTAGATVGSITPFDLIPIAEGNPADRMVLAIVPWNSSADLVEVVVDNAVRRTIERTPNAPVVVPGPVNYDPATETVAWNWNASDQDGDLLSSVVLFRNSPSADWEVLFSEYPLNGVILDATQLPGGTECQFQLVTTDGLNGTTALSPLFSLPRRAPRAMISGIINGETIPFHEVRTVTGLVLDVEDDSLAPDSYTWTWTGPESGSATGGMIELTQLTPGSYALTLAATDSDAMTGTTTVNFAVAPLTIPSGPAPTFNGFAGADYNNARVVRFSYADGQPIEARLLYSAPHLYVAFTGLRAGATEPVGFVGIRVDADASGGANATATDRGFFVNREGFPILQVGNGTGGMPIDTNPPLGFEAMVWNSAGFWTAELRIDQSLLGGWNHPARIKLGHYWVQSVGNDRNWPPASGFASPNTWALAQFGTTLPAPAITPPLARAGTDVLDMVDFPRNFVLDASASEDPNGLALTYSWAQTGGPSVVLSNANQMYPSFPVEALTSPLDLEFELTVSNGTLEDSDRVNVRLRPRPVPFVGMLQWIVDHLLDREPRPTDQNSDRVQDAADIKTFVDQE